MFSLVRLIATFRDWVVQAHILSIRKIWSAARGLTSMNYLAQAFSEPPQQWPIESNAMN